MTFIPHSRVLCVDDDRDACEMLSELLKLSGIKCLCASSAEEAQRFIDIQRFDLYVLDAWLPGLDGFELPPDTYGGLKHSHSFLLRRWLRQ